MANIKFSQFTEKTTLGTVDFLVGYKGAENVQISPTNLLSTFVSGSGTAGQVAYFDPSNNLAGENDFFWDYTNNRLGIGTITPSRTLHVKTDSGVLIKGASGSVNAKISLVPASGGRQYDLGNVGSDFRIFDSSAGVTRMYFDNDGNTGIGTTTPSSKLQVSGTLDATGISQLGSGGANVYLTSSSAGNVGIGTSSPAAKFEVNSGAIVAAFFKSSSNTVPVSLFTTNNAISTIGFRGLGSTSEYHVRVGANVNDFVAYTNNTEKLRITSGGNVGIGTSSPGARLDVRKNQAGYTYIASDNANTAASGTGSGFAMTEGGSVAWYLRNERDGSGKFNIGNSANRLTIDSSGNVGIGTSSPSEKLHIQDSTGANIILNSNTASAGGGIYMTEGSAGTPLTTGAHVYYDGGSNLFKIDTGTSSLTTRFVITRDTGNVGIGTTLPGSFYPGTNNLVVGDGSGEHAVTVYSGDDTTGYLLFADGTSGNNRYRGQVRYDHNTDSLEFATNGSSTTRLKIDSSGNATFVGDITLDDDSGASPSLYLKNGNNNFWRIFCGSSENLTFRLGTTTKFEIDSSGNATFAGTVTAGSYFLGDDASISLATTGAGTVFLRPNGQSTSGQMKVESSGNATFAGNVSADKLVVDGASNSNVSQLALTRTDFSWGIFNETDLRFYVQNGNTTTPNTQVLQIGTTGNATFAGDINVLGEDINFSTNGFADINNTGTGAIRIRPAGTTTALTLTASNATFAGDVEIANSSDGIILESPDGTRYRVTVANGGTLSVSAV